MMALDTCNASVFHGIEGAKKKLEALDRNSYPGENVTDFTSDAQRLIKIMQGVYALPVKTGSNLINKLTATLADWKYVRPSDLTVSRVDTQGKLWKFCTMCKCLATFGLPPSYGMLFSTCSNRNPHHLAAFAVANAQQLYSIVQHLGWF